MNFKNIAFSLAFAALLLAGCKDSGDDPLPPTPNPPAQNQAPTANAGADQLVLTGAAVGLSGSGSDPDGSIASLSWTQTSGAAVTLTGGSTGTPTFTAPAAAGTLVFSLTVTDNLGLARNDSVTVEVNAAPVANAGTDKTVTTNANVALSGSASDANGSIASYAWTQTSGTAVTLTGGTTAAPTFTAPASVALLQFLLTVTDNQGAVSTDSVSVTVNTLAAPVIVRQPTDIVAFENGIGLIFVVAQGENLTYEWHYESGAFWTSGPEPYMIRGGAVGGLQADDNCYYVIVSNDAGSATSEPGCMHVIAIEGEHDPSDEDSGNGNAAEAYGNAVLAILRTATGPFTGPIYPGRTGVPWALAPDEACYGATLDGVAITQVTPLPLGQHTITEIWDNCENDDPDEPTKQGGGIMITYDFPDQFGVGTYTMYLSGHGEYPAIGAFPAVMNGILTVTSERSVGATGLTHDDFEVTLEPHFCAGGFRLHSAIGMDEIELHRSYQESANLMTDAEIDWRLGLETFDDNGYVGTLVRAGGSSDIDLHFEIDDSDDGITPSHASGHVVVSIVGMVGTYYGARLSAGLGGPHGWHFFIDEPPPPDMPGDDD